MLDGVRDRTPNAVPDFPPEERDPEAEAKKAREDRLIAFGQTIAAKRREAIDARQASGVERRWVEDDNAYHGRDGIAASTGDVIDTAIGLGAVPRGGLDQQPIRARTYVQLTRQKTNAAAARLSDMLSPTEDRNWEIKPTPVPSLMNAATEHRAVPYIDWSSGAPRMLEHPTEDRWLTLGDLSTEAITTARKSSTLMQREIDDALIECGYNHQVRLAIADAARLGTGILKGPAIVNRLSKKWMRRPTADGKTVHVLHITEDARPATFRVDPWDFYPAPGCGDDPQKGEYTFELERAPGRELRNLARTEGYLRDQILACLKEGPQSAFDQTLRTAGQILNEGQYTNDGRFDRTHYELWTYVGEANAADLAAAGLAITDDPDEAELLTVSAVVVLCNSRVIKVMLNPMDTGDMPYDVFQWERVSHSPWGVGIPYLMRYAQSTLNAAWRMMLDNAAVSHAPQIVVNRAKIQPADGRQEITGRKLWYTKTDADVEDVEKAFQVFNIDCNQPMLQSIIELAMKFADEETSLPMIAQGEQGTAPETVGGMSILMNSANTVLRRLVKQWDDQITKPHIRRYYDWMMQYSAKEEIKGDYQIDARGSTALMQRESQQQALINMMSLAAHPVFGIYIDPKKLFELALKAQKFQPSDVMRSDEEVEAIKAEQAKNPPPVAPQVEVAKIRAATEKEKLALMERAQASNDQRENERMRLDDEREIYLESIRKAIEEIKLASAEKISLGEAQTRLTEVVLRNAHDRAKETQRARMEIERQQQQPQPETVQ